MTLHTLPHAEVLAMLRALVAGLSASARAIEHRTGITNAQLFLLQSLSSGGPSSLGSLAERARTQPSTVSLLVGRLQRAGLVTKDRATDDRRRAVIALTDAGRVLIRRAPVTPTEKVLSALERLSPQAATALRTGLAPLLQHLELAWDEPPLMFEQPPSRRERGRTPAAGQATSA
jgi:DNA-binding MarR family transcriptional regulator